MRRGLLVLTCKERNSPLLLRCCVVGVSLIFVQDDGNLAVRDGNNIRRVTQERLIKSACTTLAETHQDSLML